MSVTVSSSGTQTATIGTAHTLATPTEAGVYQFLVDTANLASGDRVALTIQMKVLTAGTKRTLHQEVLVGALDEPIFLSPPITAPFGADFILEQTGGTGRGFPWSVLKLA